MLPEDFRNPFDTVRHNLLVSRSKIRCAAHSIRQSLTSQAYPRLIWILTTLAHSVQAEPPPLARVVVDIRLSDAWL